MTIPNVVGYMQDVAVSILSDAGLTNVRVTESESNSDPEGTVTNQDPVAGALVDEGASISLTVAKSPPCIDRKAMTRLATQTARDFRKWTTISNIAEGITAIRVTVEDLKAMADQAKEVPSARATLLRAAANLNKAATQLSQGQVANAQSYISAGIRDEKLAVSAIKKNEC